MHPRDDNDPESHDLDVLVVEDNADTANELAEYLAKAGLKSQTAGDAWAALKLLADGLRPSVVVTDLNMPELTGMEFAERLGHFGGAERPEIIFLSGFAKFDDAVAALRLGASDMLTKPVEGMKLVQAVKSAQLARRLRHRTEGAPAPFSAGKAQAGEQQSPMERMRVALGNMKTMRRLRGQYFPTELFSDPCWEMLLDLYDASLSKHEVSVTSLAAASGVPFTTALRRMDELQHHHLITRTDDLGDKRRINVKLTEGATKAIEKFFETYLEWRRS